MMVRSSLAISTGLVSEGLVEMDLGVYLYFGVTALALVTAEGDGAGLGLAGFVRNKMQTHQPVAGAV